MGAWILLGVIVMIAVAFLVWYVMTYNRFIRLHADIEEARSTIGVFEKKRFDLIPNVVASVKGYAVHESQVFARVSEARQRLAAAATPAQRQQDEAELASSLRGLLALAEAYPDLKANTNFLDLQQQLNQVETDIASARRYYNGSVKLFNAMLRTWPSRVIARRQGFGPEPYYETDPAETHNVRVTV